MSDEKTQPTENHQDTQWTRFLEELRQWPCDAPQWEGVQRFIDQVQLVAEQKGREREEAGRFQLQQVLEKLQENYEVILVDYFQCSNLSKWEAASCPMDQVAERTEAVKDLLAQLDRRQTLDQEVPQNHLEGRKKRTELGEVELRISKLVERLGQDFPTDLLEPPLDDAAEENDQLSPEPPSSERDSSGAPTDQKAEEDASSFKKALQKEAILEEKPQTPPLPQPEDREPAPVQATPPDEKPLSLRSAQEVAVLLQAEDSDEHWESLGWSLLAEDDLAGAYWLARSLKAAGRDVPVAPELLAALQEAHWLENDTDSLVSDIRQIASEYAPQSTTSERLVGLAAALRPSLVAPHTGLVGWLPQKDEVNPGLGTLAEAVRTFASAGHPLRAEDQQGAEGRATHEKDIKETVEQARRFLATNQVSKLKFKRATDVLHRLVSPEGDLTLLLTPVIKNKADQVAQVRQRIIDFGERKQIERCLHQIDQDLAGAKKRKITGDPINQLVRSVEEAVGLANSWCSLITRERVARDKGDWWAGHVEKLRRRVQEVLPDVNVELKRMQDQLQEEAALGHVLRWAIGQVTGMLGLEEQADIEGPEERMKSGSNSLGIALSHRLLYVPEIFLDEDGHPTKDQEGDIAKYLRQSLAEKRALPMAWEMRIEGQDFRFTDVLMNALEDYEDRQRLEDRNDEELKSAQAGLKDDVNRVEGAIEKGLVDGLISEKERAALSAKLPRVEEALYFPPLFRRLDDIGEQLEQKLEERLRELEVQWKEMRQGLAQSIQADLTTAATSIQRAFTQRDTRVIEESLAHLREIRAGEREWQDEWFARPDKLDIFKKFQEACPRIEEALSSLGSVARLAEVIEQGQTWADMEFGELPQECQEEAAKVLRSWHQLKRLDGQQSKNQRYIQVLLEYLGFRPSEGKSAVSVRVKKRDQDWLYCQVDALASDLVRPIPQLGSQASGCYNVVCFWKRPRAASIGAFLRELGLDNQTVVVFSFQRLSERSRRDIAARAREKQLALVVLDEILLVFLAGLDDARLPIFLRCSLPYAALNPYTPFQAGNVPPEIYYGRDEMIRQLNEASCIVFGGRQLGKSSLLRQVEREFHQPTRKQYAWVEDIKLVGDILTGEQPARLWIKLRDGFKNNSLIRATEANQPERIIQYIKKAMEESPQLRVLVLFDEADHFLSADAKNGFQVVEGLRNLMSNTQGRFRVVFAGLHDVQRFNNIANQPLAHFGQSLLIGPLEAEPAQQLVQEPLDILGYRFADETTVLKVLSYTNYHPGLIQYFCHELVNRLQEKKYSSGPPYEVLADDVEAVYRTPRARQIIRERLDWTLALDHRYQCIAWTMIYAQKETRDSYVRSFSAAELLELAHEEWSQGFEKCDSQVFRVLLEEMVGLGILVRNLENQYLLRSPNLVRLMGTVEDIEYRLLELAEKSPPSQLRPESQHVLLEAQNRLYSPLTLTQQSDLQESGESGVALVFCSPALGLNVLDQALNRIGGSEIPAQELTRVERTCAWLQDYAARKRPGADQSLVYGQLKGTGGNMAQCVWRVWQMCEIFKQGRRRPLKVVFAFNPAATRSWLKVDADQRTDRENRAELMYLRRWDEVGIQQALSQAEKMDSPEVCQKVLEATGGWPFLLDALLRRCGDDTNPRPYADTLIEETGSELLRQVGLDYQESLVLRKLAELGTVQDTDEDLETLRSFINEDTLEDDAPLTIDACRLTVEFLHRMQCLKKNNEEYRVESVLGQVVSLL